MESKNRGRIREHEMIVDSEDYTGQSLHADIRMTAEQILSSLQTPIKGVPSVHVNSEDIAVRLIEVAIAIVFEAASTAARSELGRLRAEIAALKGGER